MPEQPKNPWVAGFAMALVPVRIVTGVAICVLVVALIVVILVHHLMPSRARDDGRGGALETRTGVAAARC